jgi:beta-galactosidase
MSLVHEENWRQLAARPYLWATWLWNSFDFATTVRREGDADDINTKGLVTYDRKIRKDPYWFYRANWSSAPTLHLNSRRYVDRADAVTDVRVYSNAPETEVSLNGRSLGVRTDCPQRTCVWQAVRLAAGANRVVALGRFPAGPLEDAATFRIKVTTD